MYIKDDLHATYKLLQPELEKKGYTTTQQVENDRRYVTFTSPQGSEWRFRAARIGYPFTSLHVKDLSVRKEIAYEYVAERGVSVPFTHHVVTGEEVEISFAEELLEKYGTLIVKPADSSLSRGLTLNIKTPDQLVEAINFSREYRDDALIQEQVEGEEIRILLIKGKVAAALLRQTARVIGDGSSTIAELIKKENEVRRTLVFPYISYPQLTEKIIDSAFFGDQTVLAEGEVKELNRATMIKNGCSVYNVLDQLHPSYVAMVEKLVTDLDTKFMAADFFFKDYTTEMTERNYWFIEFNTSPVLKLCYGCRDGKMYDIIPRLADVIDEHLSTKTQTQPLTF